MKRYDTEIVLDEEIPDVKPGVTAQAEIVVTNLSDVVIVPNQCIAMLNGKMVVYRDGFGSPKPVEVELGLFDSKFTEIKAGIKKGASILLSPPMSFDADDLDGSILREGDEIAAPEPGTATPGQGGASQTRGPSGAPAGRGGPQAAGGAGEGRGGPPGGGGGGRGAGAAAGAAGGAAGGFDASAMMKRFDTDGDGEISESEREAARAQFQRPSGGGGGAGSGSGSGGRPGGGGGSGSGRPSQ